MRYPATDATMIPEVVHSYAVAHDLGIPNEPSAKKSLDPNFDGSRIAFLPNVEKVEPYSSDGV